MNAERELVHQQPQSRRGAEDRSRPRTVGLKPINRQSDIGYTVGGPVPLGSYNKDKNRLFFFFAFEHQQRFTAARRPAPRASVPTRPGAAGRLLAEPRSKQQPVSLHPRLPARGPALEPQRNDQRAASPDGGVLGTHSAEPSLRAGHGDSEHLSRSRTPAAPTTTTRRRSPQDRDRREDILRVDWQASDRGASTAATSTTPTTPVTASAPTARSCSAPTCR